MSNISSIRLQNYYVIIINDSVSIKVPLLKKNLNMKKKDETLYFP